MCKILLDSINTKIYRLYNELLDLSIIVKNNFINYYNELKNDKIDIYWYILLTKYLNEIKLILYNSKKNKNDIEDEIKNFIFKCKENISIDDINEYLNNCSYDELNDILNLCNVFNINNININRFIKTLTFNIIKNSYNYDNILHNKITYDNKGVDEDIIKNTKFIKNFDKKISNYEQYKTNVISFDIFNDYIDKYYKNFEIEKDINYKEYTDIINQKNNNEFNIYMIYMLLNNKSKKIEYPIYIFFNL